VAFSTTLPPEQNVVAPPAEIEAVGAEPTVTVTALELAEQPLTVRCTV
jgi:hypothetical protein